MALVAGVGQVRTAIRRHAASGEAALAHVLEVNRHQKSYSHVIFRSQRLDNQLHALGRARPERRQARQRLAGRVQQRQAVALERMNSGRGHQAVARAREVQPQFFDDAARAAGS
jgi:hypothetical protein